MCIEVFGYETESAKSYAEKLGVAFQLTNILRDVKSDAEQGRIYLPREDLDQFGYTEKDVLESVYNEKFISLMEFQCRRAERFYNEARDVLAPEDQPYMLAAEIMGGTYRQILREIEKVRYDVYNHRVFLPRSRKLWIALRIWASRLATR
jgi:phytoene synthase